MAVQERTGETSLDRYIAEVRAAWGDGKDPQLPFKVAALMEKLFASTSPDDPWMAELIREGKPSRELYRDPELGFIQMGHIHKQGHGNKPHDHGPCWVVYGQYTNHTDMKIWERLDDGSQEGYADLRVGRQVKLLPGNAIAMQRGYIHSIEYPERSFFLRITGGDVEKQKTLRFAPDQKRVTVEDRALRTRAE